MAIVRAAEWMLVCPPEQAENSIRGAMAELGLEPEGPLGSIRGKSKTALLKNRWSATVEAILSREPSGTKVVWRVDMLGTKHYELLADIAEGVGDEMFDDRGLRGAIDRLHKASRIFGRKEVRHVRNLLYATERVLELGQGLYQGKQGLIVLTSERLFFLEKSLGSETLEEFSLPAIHSLTVSKKMGGEKLTVHASGNQSDIKQMMHGQADAIVRAFRTVKETPRSTQPPAAPPPAAPPQADLLGQIERLAELHSRGILTEGEFEAKKAELMGRL